MAREPERYLVPHPTDCTKFYSCQRRGWGGWIANLLDCPVTTGFDTSLLICNYISALPRCRTERSELLDAMQAGSAATGPVARQSRQQLGVQVGELGYLSSRETSAAPPAPTASLLLLLAVLALLGMRVVAQ